MMRQVDNVFKFRIDAFSPDTLPMARLAEYLAPLAALFGSEEHVHFRGVRRGSAILQAEVDAVEAAATVANRVSSAQRSDAPSDVAKAYRELNRMLQQDNASGWIKRGRRGPPLLTLPGRKTPIYETVRVIQQGTVEGTVIRVGGKDDTVPVWIRDDREAVLKCTATPDVAKRIAHHLLEGTVRANGRGAWLRCGAGDWQLDGFNIADFEVLDERPVDEVIAALRAVPGSEWNELEDPVAELERIRR